MHVGDLILQAKNLSELETLLREYSEVFNAPEDLERYLENGWINYIKQDLDVIERCPSRKINELPFSEVNLEGVSYKIHGIVHGDESKKPGQKFKKFIKEEIDKYSRMGEGYLFEGGVATMLDLDNSHEIDYRSYVREFCGDSSYVSFFSKLVDSPLTRLKVKWIQIRKRNAPQVKVQSLAYSALKDPNKLPKAREYWQKLSLPEPINLELQERLREPVPAQMSKTMAETAVKYAKTNNIETMHVICGIAHEKQIIYFLENNCFQ